MGILQPPKSIKTIPTTERPYWPQQGISYGQPSRGPLVKGKHEAKKEYVNPLWYAGGKTMLPLIEQNDFPKATRGGANINSIVPAIVQDGRNKFSQVYEKEERQNHGNFDPKQRPIVIKNWD